jgi:hypothetical protein
MVGGGDVGRIDVRRVGMLRRRFVVLAVAAIMVIGVGALDWHRRGVVVAVAAVSAWVVVTAMLVGARSRPEFGHGRRLVFWCYALQCASGFWAIGIGIQTGPLAELAVLAVLVGIVMAHYFVSMLSHSESWAQRVYWRVRMKIKL